MKRFELILYDKQAENTIEITMNKIEGDSIIEICAKIPLMIAQIQRDEHAKAITKLITDDIPF